MITNYTTQLHIDGNSLLERKFFDPPIVVIIKKKYQQLKFLNKEYASRYYQV